MPHRIAVVALGLLVIVGCDKVRPTLGKAPPGCAMCHGDPDREATALNPALAAAPPKDAHGRSDPTAPGVGAHQAHLQDGPLRGALPCTECHVLPTKLTSHPTGQLQLSWGDLALTGSTTPAYSGGRCDSTYCHGATLGAGGTNHAPLWTGGPAEAACGTCHGTPPPSPHVQSSSCGSCHPGYTLTSVNPATHVNGVPDVLGMSCTSCHGDPNRQPTPSNPQLASAPPVDTHGSSDPSAPGVGAHQPHLSDGALRGALACTDCHPIPTIIGHSTGTIAFAWSALADGNGATSPSYANGSCSATYCHGSTLGAGGTNHTPAWTGGSAEAACGTCHGAPPPTPHVQNPSCGGCHPGYGAGTVDAAAHVNGSLDLVPLTCTTCHGDAAQAATPQDPLHAAPPTDTTGASVSLRVGAHQPHLNGGAIRVPIACAECHTVPAGLAAHPNGVLDLTWGSLATGTITATINTNTQFANFSTTAPSYAAGTCSATYCHGSYSGTFTYVIPDAEYPPNYATVAYAGDAASPSWDGGPVTCSSCHGDPPATGGWHSGTHSGGNDCSLCHPDAAGLGGSSTITNPALHVDGKVDLAPRFRSSCWGCH